MSVSSESATLWRAGRLRYKLHAGQKKAYDKYREWEKNGTETRKRGGKLPGIFPRVFVLNCGRRFGKDFLSLLIRIEDCIRTPKQLISYGTAFAKDIASISLPLVDILIEDCPESLKPVFKASYQGVEAGFYFPNGSVLRLIGLDSNPDGLRGRFSSGMVVSEASFVTNLKGLIQSIILPQFMSQLAATIILNSTPSEDPAHSYKTDFIPDAIVRDAYVKATIYDNPRIGEAERQEFIDGLGGAESDRCRRELFCEDVRSETRTVVPEFSQIRHVVDMPRPQYAVGYTVLDPGMRDLCAIQCSYYDFDRAKLVIAADWAKRNASITEVARAIRECEAAAFEGLSFWKDKAFGANPYQRYSDTDTRLIHELNTSHNIKCGVVDKVGAEAALNAIRNAFHGDRIEVRTTAIRTIQHLEGAIWNKSRSDYERSDALGHCDLLDATKYAWRMMNPAQNPMPPRGVLLAQGTPLSELHWTESHMKTDHSLMEKVRKLLPTGRFRSSGLKRK